MLYRRVRVLKSENRNKMLISVQGMAFDTFSSFFNQIGHYMPYKLCSKNIDQLPVLNRLTDIFAVGKFDYGVMVRYQNLTRKPKLFNTPWARARCTLLSQALPITD